MKYIKCSICKDKNKLEMVNERLSQGRSVLGIANELGLSEASVRRHNKNHYIVQLSKAFENSPTVETEKKIKPKLFCDFSDGGTEFMPHDVAISTISKETMVTNIKYLLDNSVDVIEKAKINEDDGLRLRGIKEARSTMEVVIKAAELFFKNETKQEWTMVYNKILKVLSPHKEIKAKVIKILTGD